jgi:hypothetical protein
MIWFQPRITSPFPAVNGILVAGQNVNIHVSQEEQIDDTPLRYIDNALITLFKNEIAVAEMPLFEYGLYYSHEIVRSGEIYGCSIRSQVRSVLSEMVLAT